MNSAERLAAVGRCLWEASLLQHALRLNRSKPVKVPESDDVIQTEFQRTLDKVCAGCDRDWIVGHFAMRLEPMFMPTDNWETLTAWERRSGDGEQTKKGYFDARNLKALEKLAGRLLSDVRKLQTTPWIAKLIQQGIIRPGDLLHQNTSFDSFDGILKLVKLASKARPKKRKEDENDLLSEIVLHVHGHTGQWRDAEIGHLNYALGLPQTSADAMKSWRRARGKKDRRFTAPKPSRKSGNSTQ